MRTCNRNLRGGGALAIAAAILVSLGPGLACAQVQQPSGSFELAVLDQDGRPAKGIGAYISKLSEYVRSPASGRLTRVPPGPGSTQHAASDEAGAVKVAGLPPGQYQACIFARQLGVLDPCIWSGVATFSVVAGQKTAFPAVRLTKGGLLQVRFLDPAGLLPKSEPLMNPAMIVGVVPSTRGFIGMKGGQRSVPGGREYTMTVPFDTPLKLRLFSRSLRLTDESGRAVDNPGASIPFSVPSGQAKIFTFTVAAVAP